MTDSTAASTLIAPSRPDEDRLPDPPNSSRDPSWGVRLWTGLPGRYALPLAALVAVLAIPGVGVLVAFAIALFTVLAGRRAGSVRSIGLRPPESWPHLLGTTFALGFGAQVVWSTVVDPLLARMTGAPLDLSSLDGVRGDLGNFLILLAVGWLVGGMIEEFTFRGFLLTRVRAALGGGAMATWAAMLASAVPFGLAHLYQGPAGMISTGLLGFLFAVIFVRMRDGLWYAVFAHGFANTLGIALIYLDLDHVWGQWLF